jgi:beta-lactamase superfamily II metal-dependent hydrolase
MKPLLASLFFFFASLLPAAKNLTIYTIDVEGGQSTLFVAPSGESLLVDTGYTGNNHRDALRIAAAAKNAGVKKIDYLIITHYHNDHVGGIYQLAEKMPIVNFIDHGAQTETGKDAEILYNEYSAIRAKGHRIEIKPGDTLPLKNLDVKILASNGDVLSAALPGAGEANPACANFAKPATAPGENERSIGMLITFGDFRMLDMGDLTDDHEYDLVCPANKIGTVDLFLASHHGGTNSNSVPFVHAIAPRVAIVNNGPHKGGSPAAWQTLRDTRSLIDIWQLHYALDTDKAHNAPDTFIANLDANCEGKWIKITAEKDGNFTVVNARNKFEKTYTKR